MRTILKCAVVAAIVVTLGNSSLSAGRGLRVAIDRDGNSMNPVKVIHRIVVRLFDELGIPRP
jgi:hypothetical protein